MNMKATMKACCWLEEMVDTSRPMPTVLRR